MPSTITHEYHYRDTYKNMSNSFKGEFDLEFYRKYSAFAQGHDALFFANFWNVPQFFKRREKALYIQDNFFQELCIEMVDLINKYGYKDIKVIKLLLYGYMMHHILDSYMHPYVIYETQSTPQEHERFETYLDGVFLKEREGVNPRIYKIHTLIPNMPKLSKETISTVDKAFKEIYGFENFGKLYERALRQVNLVLYILRYDPIGYKRVFCEFFDSLHLMDMKTSWLSYNSDLLKYQNLMNDEHNAWNNPTDATRISWSSVRELYELAVKDAAKIISELNEAIKDGATKQELEDIIPNKSAIHGLECNKHLTLSHVKIRK